MTIVNNIGKTMTEFIDYGFVPETTCEECKNHEPIHVEGLYYVDANGNKQTPNNLYFSSDMRNFTQDANAIHGKAFTCYLSGGGTTLSPVYLPNGERYRCEDLCCVSARYKDGCISGFYKE